MTVHNDLGRMGEEAACLYLIRHGYRLLARNAQFGHHEIDIVADHYGELVFVEVKTRRRGDHEAALWAVDNQKRMFLCEAAYAYRCLHNLRDCPYRFDVITLIGNAPPFDIEHCRHVFSPEGVRLAALQKPRQDW